MPDKHLSVATEQTRSVPAGQALGLAAGERLVVKDVITDADGSTHVRYNRTFAGLRVLGGDLVSHRDKASKIKAVSWNSSRNVAVPSTKARMSLAAAKAKGAKTARTTCNASTVTPIGRDKAAKIWYRALSIAVPAGVATCSIPPLPPAGNNLVSNPGFESGATRWSATPEVIGVGAVPRSGAWSAWLGGYGVVHDGSISQMVRIPADSRATLSYYVHIETDEQAGSPAYDTMRVRAGSTVLQTLSNLDAARASSAGPSICRPIPGGRSRSPSQTQRMTRPRRASSSTTSR